MIKNDSLKERLNIFGDDALLNMREAAQYLGVTIATIYHWRRNNKIHPPIRMSNGYSVRYKLKDLKQFLNGI